MWHKLTIHTTLSTIIFLADIYSYKKQTPYVLQRRTFNKKDSMLN